MQKGFSRPKICKWKAEYWLISCLFQHCKNFESNSVVLIIVLPWQRTNLHIKSLFRFTT